MWHSPSLNAGSLLCYTIVHQNIASIITALTRIGHETALVPYAEHAEHKNGKIRFLSSHAVEQTTNDVYHLPIYYMMSNTAK